MRPRSLTMCPADQLQASHPRAALCGACSSLASRGRPHRGTVDCSRCGSSRWPRLSPANKIVALRRGEGGRGGMVESPRARVHLQIRQRHPPLPKVIGKAVSPVVPVVECGTPPSSTIHTHTSAMGPSIRPTRRLLPMSHRGDDAARRIDAVNPQPQHSQLRNLEHHRMAGRGD